MIAWTRQRPRQAFRSPSEHLPPCLSVVSPSWRVLVGRFRARRVRHQAPAPARGDLSCGLLQQRVESFDEQLLRRLAAFEPEQL
jgi:hypothetical protein